LLSQDDEIRFDDSHDFYKIKEDQIQYWREFEIENPGKKKNGWKQYKRWEWFWENRLNEDGNLPNSNILHNEMLKFDRANKNILNDKTQGISDINHWHYIGPDSIPNPGYYAMGRVNLVRTRSVIDNEGKRHLIIYAGTSSSGLWRSIDTGKTWTDLTSKFPDFGVSDIAFNPKDSNEIYIGTGAKSGSGTIRAYGIGILKSTDGGNTWLQTNINRQKHEKNIVTRILIHPQNPDTVFSDHQV
jgi:hypothetical protein